MEACFSFMFSNYLLIINKEGFLPEKKEFAELIEVFFLGRIKWYQSGDLVLCLKWIWQKELDLKRESTWKRQSNN